MTTPPLPLPPLPTPPTPAVKNAVTTTEFWGHALVQLAIFILTALTAHSTSLPPVAQAALAIVGPVVMGYLQKNYMSDRSDLKTAAINAGAAASNAIATTAAAAAAMRTAA